MVNLKTTTMENRISVTINATAEQAILAAIATIETNLPYVVNLSADERQYLPKMGDKSIAFVNKALEYAKQNPSVVPSFLDLVELEKDVTAVTALSKVVYPLRQLLEKLDDTVLLSGSEAYTEALVFYTALKGAAKAGVPGMKTVYDDMQARFPGRGKAQAAK